MERKSIYNIGKARYKKKANSSLMDVLWAGESGMLRMAIYYPLRYFILSGADTFRSGAALHPEGVGKLYKPLNVII
jgi:hypothetical protein